MIDGWMIDRWMIARVIVGIGSHDHGDQEDPPSVS
jgi:hypothetical protein